MRVKHLNILWVIVAFGTCLMPRWAAAEGAGVIIERAQVSSLESGAALQIDVSIRNQLSVAVRAVELGLECQGTPTFEKRGRRTMGVGPGTSVSAFLIVAGPQVKPQDCSVRLLGYELDKPTDAVLQLLLATGYSADERAALLAAQGEHSALIDWRSWASRNPSSTPRVHQVLERLLSWFALTQDNVKPATVLPKVDGLEKYDQPLQIILAARAQGSRFSSPLAFLLPDGVSTMKDAKAVFEKRQFVSAAALDEFKTESLTSNQPIKAEETSNFYRNLSLVLLTGIIIWALWGFRKKSRAGVSNDV